MKTPWEREEEWIDEQYERGELSGSEYTKALNELHRDYREAAQEAAWDRFNDELERW